MDRFNTRRGDTPEELAQRALISGSTASVLSTIASAFCGKRDCDNFVAPTNATSHWIWGERAAHSKGLSVRYTLVGYLIHHLASIFWAVLFERWSALAPTKSASRTLLRALSVAALACLVDYTITPKRLTPGFEKRLKKRSLAVIYTVFGIGLVCGRMGQEHRKGSQRGR
jgi:hypothetical protein